MRRVNFGLVEKGKKERMKKVYYIKDGKRRRNGLGFSWSGLENKRKRERMRKNNRGC